MIKYVVFCAMLLVLCGCSTKHLPAAGEPPTGLIKMFGDEKAITYVDFRTISNYQGNNHLRQFYLIKNYIKPTRISQNSDSYVFSLRSINVVNCDKRQWTVFDLIFFSLPYGEGDVIAKSNPVGQWDPIMENTIVEIIAKMVCVIGPEHLKPQPPKDTRKPLLDM